MTIVMFMSLKGWKLSYLILYMQLHNLCFSRDQGASDERDKYNTWEVREMRTKFQPGILKGIGHFRNLGVNMKIYFKERGCEVVDRAQVPQGKIQGRTVLKTVISLRAP
jgi:hypothetical protein